MPLITSNAYGTISVTDEVVASIAGRLAMECYGVVELVPRKLSDTLADLFKRNNDSRGVKIVSKGDRVYIDLYVVFKFGMSLNAVADSLKNTIKYGVENFTSMIVDTVNVHVMGVRL
ncbi:MAG: Asp23/Gls24 family envelope stress response protein [Clostridia bacterium]